MKNIMIGDYIVKYDGTYYYIFNHKYKKVRDLVRFIKFYNHRLKHRKLNRKKRNKLKLLTKYYFKNLQEIFMEEK